MSIEYEAIDQLRFNRFRYKQLWVLLGSQCIFGLSYWFLLSISYAESGIATGESIIGFSIRGLLLIPVYWIIFVRFGNRSSWTHLLLHTLIIVVYLSVSLFLYRLTCRYFGVKYLIGTYGNWDIYIPALIYIIQFFCIHIWEYFIRLKAQKEKEINLRESLLETELKMLRAQIQPHFLFNSLNSISATIPQEMENIRESISQLAEIFRFTLVASKRQLILVSEELSFIKNYLSIEQSRYPTRFIVEYKIDPGTLGNYLPPMLLQPIVENCIKYALDPDTFPIVIRIFIFRLGTKMVFQVSDTGPGLLNKTLDELYERGTGLFNISQRLMAQFGEELNAVENIPHGLVLTFSIPSNLQP